MFPLKPTETSCEVTELSLAKKEENKKLAWNCNYCNALLVMLYADRKRSILSRLPPMAERADTRTAADETCLQKAPLPVGLKQSEGFRFTVRIYTLLACPE